MNPQQSPPAPPVIPVRLERYEHEPRPVRRFWLHPVSAVVILALDWLFFAEEVVTFELALPFACAMAFLSTTAAVYWIQRRKSGDSRGKALIKALFGGFIAGLPTSVGGTVLGTVVLLLAGLRGAPSINSKTQNPNSR